MKKLFTLVLVFAMTGLVHAMTFESTGGRALRINYEGQFGFSYRDTGSGAEYDESTGEFGFRRNRINFVGNYNDYIQYYFQTEYKENSRISALSVEPNGTGQNFYVLDAQIRFNQSDAFKVWVGKLKHNLTRANLESCFEPLTFDRSIFVYTPFNTSRDQGIAVWGNLFDGIAQYRVDAMNGNTVDRPGGGIGRYTARLNVSLLEPEKGYGVSGTYLGNKQVLTFGGGVQYEPDSVYGNLSDKKNSDTYDYLAYSFDVFFEQPMFDNEGAFTLSAGYLNISFDEAYRDANPNRGSFGLNGEKNGYYVMAGFLLPMKIGPGKVQFFGRYDDFQFANLNNGATDFFDQQVTRTAFGFNYYIFGQDLKITGEYYMMEFDKEDLTDPNYQNFGGFDLYLQVRI